MAYADNRNGSTFELRVLFATKLTDDLLREANTVANRIALYQKDKAKENLSREERKQYKLLDNILCEVDNMTVTWSKIITLLEKKKDL